MKRAWLAMLPLLLCGCVTPISDQYRTLVDPQATFAAVRKAPDTFLGKHLLLGGRIITSTSTNELSRLEIQQVPVDPGGVPINLDQPGGRFIAESTTFYDNTIYRPEMMVTLVGEVIGKRQLPDALEPVPVLIIKELYLWDPAKFGRRPPRDENPFSATHGKPLPDRPLSVRPHRPQ